MTSAVMYFIIVAEFDGPQNSMILWSVFEVEVISIIIFRVVIVYFFYFMTIERALISLYSPLHLETHGYNNSYMCVYGKYNYSDM